MSDFEIKKHSGLDYDNIQSVIKVFEPLEGATSSAIPLETKVITYLSYLRTGVFQWSLGTLTGTSQPLVSKIIDSCTNLVLNTVVPEHISFPVTSQEIVESKLHFTSLCRYKGFPNVLGVVDGTHVAILSPSIDEDRYVNRKNFHSINCQIVCNSNHKILDVVAKWPGSSHDSLIWRRSEVQRRLNSGQLGDGWFLGDSGYPLQSRLLTPFLEPRNIKENNYNKSHILTRAVVERSIGIWKSRFRAFHW